MTKVYDNGGQSIDRYTVIIDNDVYTMSTNALSPNGFNQYYGSVGDILRWENVGQEVSLMTLPKEVYTAIKDRALGN